MTLRLNGETIICILGNDPAVVETCVGANAACDFHLEALPQRSDSCHYIGAFSVELRHVFHEDVGRRGFVGIDEFCDQFLVCGLEHRDIGLKVRNIHILP